jgi:hypothetical protein
VWPSKSLPCNPCSAKIVPLELLPWLLGAILEIVCSLFILLALSAAFGRVNHFILLEAFLPQLLHPYNLPHRLLLFSPCSLFSDISFLIIGMPQDSNVWSFDIYKFHLIIYNSSPLSTILFSVVSSYPWSIKIWKYKNGTYQKLSNS